MAISLRIIAETPHTDISFQIPGAQKLLRLGKKIIVDEKERNELRLQYIELYQGKELDKIQAQLDDIKIDAKLSAQEVLTQSEALQEQYKQELQLRESKLLNFYKSFVVFLQDAQCSYVDENSNETKIVNIADTRTAQPIESLWGDSDTCLAVLLDLYLGYSPFKDSFVKIMEQTLFSDAAIVEAKVKN